MGSRDIAKTVNVGLPLILHILCMVSQTLVKIPMTEFFSDPADADPDFQLPRWLADHVDLYKKMMRSGNALANTVLGMLERGPAP